METSKALILSAGMSTRIAPISKGRPKTLIEIKGSSVLSRNIRWLAGTGVRDLWINLHYRPEEIMDHVGNGSQFGASVKYSFEPEILGTAGAVKKLEREWKGTFLVVYGDNLFDFWLEPFYRFHKENGCIATLALFDQKTHLHTGVAGGRVVLDGPFIQKFIEGTGKSSLVNAGAYFLEPEILEYIPAQTMFDFGRELFPLLLGKGIKIAGYLIDGYCLGIDTPESYYSALEKL